MRDDEIPEDVLERLPRMLTSAHLPVQLVIAKAIGADQPFVSRVLNGEVKRVTDRVERLWKYASSRIAEAERAVDAVADLERESLPAGDGGVAGHAAQPRLQNESTDAFTGSDAYADDALSGVKAYLADGYDPRLIVEQLVVLRRAQQVRRPGRTTGKAI
ncbi:hypothetical protein U1839_03900 [Sphingomonas sp. RT2P30]|uniref:hypothetical protein n=1 Tax=Parasphingomonas halimpatiens TaxID=3096162 RepID=UPI002FC5B38C